MDHEDPDTVAVSRLGKKFTVMEMLWLRQSRETFHTRLDTDFDPKTRFENDKSKVQGQRQDLQECLLPEYCEMLDKRGPGRHWLSDTVSNSQTTTVNYHLISHHLISFERQ